MRALFWLVFNYINDLKKESFSINVKRRRGEVSSPYPFKYHQTLRV